MVERQEAEHDGIGREGRGIWPQDLIDVCDQVIVREHDALGQSRGPAGVGKSSDVFLRTLDRFGKLGVRRSQQGREIFAAVRCATRGESTAKGGKAGEVYVFEKRSIGD